MAARRDFKRPFGKKEKRRVFIVASEGRLSENGYFSQFNNVSWSIFVKVRTVKKNNKSAPHQVLKYMKKYLSENHLESNDKAWIVIDTDHWNEDEIQKIHEWAQSHENYGIAVSNPNFEYWLLLHFEEGNKMKNTTECSRRLKKHWPEYNKEIDPEKFKKEVVCKAVQRAKLRDTPRCSDWPRTIGKTTVYRLVEQILNS